MNQLTSHKPTLDKFSVEFRQNNYTGIDVELFYITTAIWFASDVP